MRPAPPSAVEQRRKWHGIDNRPRLRRMRRMRLSHGVLRSDGSVIGWFITHNYRYEMV